MQSFEFILVLSITLSVLSAVIFFLRLFSRWHVCRRLGWDDYMITIAVVFSYLFTIPIIIAAYNGLGRPIEVVGRTPGLSISTVLLMMWLAQTGHVLALGCVKASALLFFTSLGAPWLRKTSIFLLYYIGIQTVALSIAGMLRCIPVESYWNAVVPYGSCVNIDILNEATTYLNLITDIIIYILPAKLLWSLQLPRKQKWGLGVILCLGLLTCVASALRIYERPYDAEADVTLAVAPTFYWAEVEINCAIIAASIPALKPLAKRYLSRKDRIAGDGPESKSGPKPQGRILPPRQLSPSRNGPGSGSNMKVGSIGSLKRSISGSSKDKSAVVLKTDAAVLGDLEKGRYFVTINGGSDTDGSSNLNSYSIR